MRSDPGAGDQRKPAAGNILWWGRSGTEYPRNQIFRRLLTEAGFGITDFRPRISATGDIEASLSAKIRADLVWVPCFRQRDLAAARRWSTRRGLPLIFDPLISAYDKQVFEREKLPAGGFRANRLLAWEKRIFGCVDLLLADTESHAEFFHRTLGVDKELIHVVPLCADEQVFRPMRNPGGPHSPLEVLFFGSFIPLQGPEVIVEAANLYGGPPVRWCLVGEGPLRGVCRSQARKGAPIQFEHWLPYVSLPSRIARADIVLGIFGDTPKAARVVPNKVCQALACARPVLTRSSPAYPADLRNASGSGIAWLPAANAEALSIAVAEIAASPGSLEAMGQQARATYRRYFSVARVRRELMAAVESVLEKAAAQ